MLCVKAVHLPNDVHIQLDMGNFSLLFSITCRVDFIFGRYIECVPWLVIKDRLGEQ